MPWTPTFETELEDYFKTWIPSTAADAIGDASSLLKLLVANSNGDTGIIENAFPKSKFVVPAGDRIETKIDIARLSARGSVSGYGLLNTDHNRTTDTAIQDWGTYYGIVSVTEDELNANGMNGKYAKFNLMENKLRKAFADVMDLIGHGLYNYGVRGAGSMVGDEANGILGLGQLAGNYESGALIGGSNRVWMGLDSTSLAGWNAANVDDTPHALADLSDPGSDSFIQTIIRTMVYSCMKMNTQPSVVVTTKAIYEVLEDSLTANQRYTSGSTLGALGFEFLKVSGIPVIWDSYCPDYHMYALNTRNVKGQPALALATRDENIITMGEKWLEPINQFIKTRKFRAQVNLFSAYPRLHASAVRVGV